MSSILLKQISRYPLYNSEKVRLMKLNRIEPLNPYQRARRLGLQSSFLPKVGMSQAVQETMNFAKKKDRSNLKLHQWKRNEYYKTDATQQLFSCPDQIERRDSSSLTLEQFTERYQKTNTPVIIKGCTETWNPEVKWNHRYFFQNFYQTSFKIGEDDDGNKIRVPFKTYIEYLLMNQDDSPLYLFESSLQDHKNTRQIINNYQIPFYFKDDLFKLAGQDKRPPYRWFIMGPQRSGTTIHIDPLMTSAWNASLKGHKRWVLFGGKTPKSIVKGKQFRTKSYDDQSINYFVQILPRIKQKYAAENLQIIQFIQCPGETVFVPGGLWHAVINLDDTIAVTQNVMTHYCFDKVWRSTRCQRRKFAENFLETLHQNAPQFYQRAIAINEADSYEMGNKYCQQQVSLSFTPSSSSSDSSSQDESKQSEYSEQCKVQTNNRVNIMARASKFSSRQSVSPDRSRQKKPKQSFSQEKKPIRRRNSLPSAV